MEKIKCKCGTKYTPTSGDLHTVYSKKKPNGKYNSAKVAYCPNCGRGVVVGKQ